MNKEILLTDNCFLVLNVKGKLLGLWRKKGRYMTEAEKALISIHIALDRLI